MILSESPLVSIIIPIYNVEDYLRKCLESVCNQTYKNIEIILVDDGSIDGSGMIAQDMATSDKRIVYFHQDNQGLSAARNAGIALATGEYFLFIDSDDWVASSLVEDLLSLALENEALFSAGGYLRVKNDKEVRIDNKAYYSKVVPGYKYAELMSRPLGAFCFAWARLMHKSLWTGNEFPVGRAFEDIFIMPRIAYGTNRIAFTNKPLYYYRIRETSISHSKFSLKSLDEMDGYLELISLADEKKNRAIRFYASSFFLVKYYIYKTRIKGIGISSREYRDKYIPYVRKCWKILLTFGFFS